MESPVPARILITGYSGFVGRFLVPACRRRYPAATLFGLGHAGPSSPGAAAAGLIPLPADITHADQVRAAVAQSRPDLVVHLAAASSVAASWADPAGTLLVNALGGVHLLEALRAEGLAPRTLLVGSGEMYGPGAAAATPVREDAPLMPLSPYAVAKATQDLYGYQHFVAYGTPILRVRAFNHFGPGQSAAFVIASFARQIARIEAGLAPPVVLVGNLAVRRDFLPVEDVVAAYLALAERGQPGAAYNVAAGEALALADLLERLLAHSGARPEIRPDPARLRPVDTPLIVADTTKLRRETGWTPTQDVDAALARTLEDWRAQVRAGRANEP